MHLRAITESECDLVRDLRIAALKDAPGSFAENAEEATSRPRSYWEDLTRALTTTHVMFVVEHAGRVCGSVYGLRDRENENSGRVGGMWVASAQRGEGLGAALLGSVLEWAKTRGFVALRLWAPAEMRPALALYTRAGFEPTGNVKTVPGAQPFDVIEMFLEMGESSSARSSDGPL